MKNNSFEDDSKPGEGESSELQEDFLAKKKAPQNDRFNSSNKKQPFQAPESIQEGDDNKNDQLLEMNFDEPKKVGKMPKFLGRPPRQKKTEPIGNDQEEVQKNDQEMVVEIKPPVVKFKQISTPKKTKEPEPIEIEDKPANIDDEPDSSIPVHDPFNRPLKSNTKTSKYNMDNIEEMETTKKSLKTEMTEKIKGLLSDVNPEEPAIAEERAKDSEELLEDAIMTKPKARPAKPSLAKPKPTLTDEIVLPKEIPQIIETSQEITETPIKVNNFTSELEDRPLKNKGDQNNGYDVDNNDGEQDVMVPIKKTTAKTITSKTEPLEDRPLGGKGPNAGYDLDNLDQLKDTYVPSKKAPTKPTIPKNEPVMEDRPLGGKGPDAGYDLDNLDQVKDTYVPSKKAPAKLNIPKNDPISEDRPLGGKGPDAGYDLDNLDQVKDTYVPSKKAPAKPSIPKNEPVMEDRPLGGKGPDAGYDLDNLDQVKDTYVPSKKAPAKLNIQKNDPISEDRPLGGKGPDAGYNLDNLDELEKGYKPSAKALASRGKPAPSKNTEDTLPGESEKPLPTKPTENPIKPAKAPPSETDTVIKEVDEIPIGGGAKANNQFSEANAFPPDQGNNDGGIDDADATLEGRMRNPNFAVKSKAYDDIIAWADETITPEYFAKSLHLTVKEKHPQIVDKILTIIENLIENHKAAWQTVDFKKFLTNYGEHLMTNVKGASKDHSLAVIPTIWTASKKEEFLATLKDEMLKKSKVKLQENALIIVLELVKAGKIEELGFFKPIKDELESLIASRSVSLKNFTMAIYKEAFLWLGEAIKAFTAGIKKPQMDELEAYFKTVDPAQMKMLKKNDGTGKGKALDVYDMVAEIELPKKFNDEAWVDEVLACTKWNERKAKIDELNEILIKAPKISPKTNIYNFLNLTRKIFMETNVAVQVAIIKTLGLLAASLRKHFVNVSKTLFPVLLGKLKEKNRSLSEEIILTLEKFFNSLTFEETHDDFKEHLKDKNTDKKINLLRLMLTMVDKLDKIKTDANAVKMVKLVIGLLDENDVSVRDTASQLIAKLKDNFNDKITPLLSDLNGQKMSKITKFCQNSSSIVATGPGKDKPDTDAKIENESVVVASTRKVVPSMSKDKSQVIAEMRENLFSNKTVKLSDTKNFSNFLYTNLKILTELTKEFKEVSTTQSKEILILVQEIAAKVDKAAFPEDSRKILVQFYIEQLLCKNSDEIFDSIDQLVYHPNKIVTPKIFLTDLFDVVSRKSIKVSRELLVAVLKIIDKEVANNSQLSLLPHKAFIDFLKCNFSGQSIHQSYKTPLLTSIRNYGKKFGDKSLNDFPTSLIKELESQNSEAQKAFSKTLEKLNDKNPEKKKGALAELANYEEVSKILLFWTNNDFVTYLKRMLIMETRGPNYGSLLMILSRYLNIFKESPSDFSMKSYIFVFQAVLTHYYDRKDNDRFNPEIEALVRTSVTILGATNMINEFIGDASAVAWKEQILNFYFQFAGEIDTSVRFINYLISLVGQKGPANEIRPLIESVLLLLKGTSNDELILKGNENKYIREVWQKNEEDLLINENFIKGTKVFEDSGSFTVVKNFICESLKIEDSNFYTRNFEPYAFNENDTSPKIKLAYFYMRSIENLPRCTEFILRQLAMIDLTDLDNVSLLICLKISFQILKNIFYLQGDELFLRAREIFTNILHRLPFTFDEFFKIADFSGHEINYFNLIINNEEFRIPEVEPPTPMKTNSRNPPVTTINDLPPMQTPIPAKDPNLRSVNQERRGPSHMPPSLNDEDQPLPPRNAREHLVPASPRSHISSSKKAVNMPKPPKFNNNGNDNMSSNNFNQAPEPMAPYYPPQNQQMNGDELHNPMLLQDKFDKMLTFDLGEFEDASEYFKALCRSQDPNCVNFLKMNSNDIIKVFVEVCATVFNEGINYDLERSSYELIFVPFQLLCAIDEFLLTLQQPILNILVEHVLLRLVLSNEEKTILEQKNEEQSKQELAGFMVKFWNSIMLRIIENAEVNGLLTALFILIINYRDFEVDKLHQAIYNLAFKCIIRITRNLKTIMEKIDPRIVLNLIFNYIQTFGAQNSESLGSKSIKTLLNELVIRSDPEYIWGCYMETFGEQGEPHISKWIRVIQSKNGLTINTPEPDVERELYDLIQEINKQTRISQIAVYINDIRRILEEQPSLDIRSFAEVFANKSYYEYVIKELRVNKGSMPGLNNTATKQGSMQGMNNFNSTTGFSNQKQMTNPASVKGGNVPSTKKSPINVKKTKNIDDYLNKSDMGDASEVYRRMDDRSRYNF